MPYLGWINWESVTKALADIYYDGVFTLETFLFCRNFPDDILETTAHQQYDMAKYLAENVEKYKEKRNH